MNELQKFENKLELYKEIVNKLEYKSFRKYVMYLRYSGKTVKRNKHIRMLKILEKLFDIEFELRNHIKENDK